MMLTKTVPIENHARAKLQANVHAFMESTGLDFDVFLEQVHRLPELVPPYLEAQQVTVKVCAVPREQDVEVAVSFKLAKNGEIVPIYCNSDGGKDYLFFVPEEMFKNNETIKWIRAKKEYFFIQEIDVVQREIKVDQLLEFANFKINKMQRLCAYLLRSTRGDIDRLLDKASEIHTHPLFQNDMVLRFTLYRGENYGYLVRFNYSYEDFKGNLIEDRYTTKNGKKYFQFWDGKKPSVFGRQKLEELKNRQRPHFFFDIPAGEI